MRFSDGSTPNHGKKLSENKQKYFVFEFVKLVVAVAVFDYYFDTILSLTILDIFFHITIKFSFRMQ
jgi:hypothetical protein